MRSSIAALLLLSACGPSTHRLVVEVRSDLGPGVEFTRVRTELAARREDRAAARGEDYVTGVRVAELDGLEPGSHTVVVSLLDGADVVVDRELRVEVREDTAVVVVLTRSCQTIECPSAGGEPSLSTCVAGTCVDPRCVEEGSFCPPRECTGNDECGAAAACARSTCEDGVCFSVGDDAMCGAGEHCDPDEGCRLPGGGSPDGGLADAGAPDGGAPDAGPVCGSERLLATATDTSDGSFSGVYPELVVVLSAGGAQIGEEDRLPDGYTGATDFRPADDPDFVDLVAALTRPTPASASMAIGIPGGAGSFSPITFSASVSGLRVSRIRRAVSMLTFQLEMNDTVYSGTATWELWGCDP